MHTLQTYLVLKLQEEHMEVAMAVSKALTFGWYDLNPATGLTNHEQYIRENIDVAVVGYLSKRVGYRLPSLDAAEHAPSGYSLAERKYFFWKLGKLIRYTLGSFASGMVSVTAGQLNTLLDIHTQARSMVESIEPDLLIGKFVEIPDDVRAVCLAKVVS